MKDSAPFDQIRLPRYLAIGASAAALFFVLSFILVTSGLPPFAGAAIAYAIAFAAAYCAQHRWTFGAATRHRHSLPRYFALQVGCALMSGLLSHLAVTRFGLSPLGMSVLVTLAASAVSYVLSSNWAFKERSGR